MQLTTYFKLFMQGFDKICQQDLNVFIIILKLIQFLVFSQERVIFFRGIFPVSIKLTQTELLRRAWSDEMDQFKVRWA